MVQFLDGFFIGVSNRLKRLAAEFHDEAGVSGFVATILLILIVVLLCAAFWTNINNWFTETWNKIINQADTIQ